MTTVSTPQTQEPPFPAAPFLDERGQVNTIWQLWLINLWQSQNGQNSAIGDSAPSASPAFTGIPTAPTAAPLTDNTQLATTKYADSAVTVEETRAEAEELVLQNGITAETARAEGAEAGLQTEITAADTAIAAETARAEAAEALLAPQASPTFTGTVTTPAIDITGAQAIGNGADANVQAPALGTGSGPVNPNLIVGWIPIGGGGYVPVCA